jgi:hypothetical protein
VSEASHAFAVGFVPTKEMLAQHHEACAGVYTVSKCAGYWLCQEHNCVQWVSGASDGSLSVWSQLKKRPVSTVKQAHAHSALDGEGGAAAPDSDAASWVQSVAACRSSDLVVSRAHL